MKRSFDLGYERLRREREDMIAAVLMVMFVLGCAGVAWLLYAKFQVRSWSDLVEFVKAMRYLF